jgi:Ca2+-binding RTX toxin-like protein
MGMGGTWTIGGGHTTNLGNGNDTIAVYGDWTVKAGNGHDDINVHGDGSVKLGNGNDFIGIWGKEGSISVGSGSDTLDLWRSGTITEHGASGHDTITLFSGNATVTEQGHATVHGSSHGTFGNATVVGGQLEVYQHGENKDVALDGKITIVGGSAPTEFVGGSGSALLKGGSGHDTFVGGSGQDTLVGTGSHNVFEFLSSEQGGQHVIQNFVAGDTLYVEGHSLSYLQSHGDITTKHGNTIITIDGGKTTIELKGVTSLSWSDFTNHKP